jgi:tripartite-type tricarboxylate transporter receptor subunit TctC
VVENRAGANGMIGTEAVVRAPADGYTLGVALADTYAINPLINRNISYDPREALVGVAPLAIQSFALIVNTNVPASSLEELVALAHARPGEIRFGSWGEGSTGHLGLLMLQRAAGFQATHVAYRGAAAAVSDLVAGHIEAMITSVSAAVTQQRDGRVRTLAVTGTERHPSLPEVPALAETWPDVVVRAWYAVMAPARTPAPIVAKLNAAIGRAMQAPDVRARITEGFLATPMVMSVPDFAAFLCMRMRNAGAASSPPPAFASTDQMGVNDMNEEWTRRGLIGRRGIGGPGEPRQRAGRLARPPRAPAGGLRCRWRGRRSARLLGEALRPLVNQPFVVENRAGRAASWPPPPSRAPRPTGRRCSWRPAPSPSCRRC